MPQPPPSDRPMRSAQDLRDFDRQRRAAGAGVTQRGQIALLEARGGWRCAIHMVGTPGKAVARLTSMSRSTASTSKRWCSRMTLPRSTCAQQDRGQREDVEQRQDADHLVDRGAALGARGRRPRRRRSRWPRAGCAWVSIAPFGRPVVPPVYCKRRDVVRRRPRARARRRRAIDELAEGDDSLRGGHRQQRIGGRAPALVLADDDAVEQALARGISAPPAAAPRDSWSRARARRCRLSLCDSARSASSGEQMHDPRAGLGRAEEVDRMVRRVAEEQRDRRALAVAGARKAAAAHRSVPARSLKDDLAVAEVDDRALAVFCGKRVRSAPAACRLERRHPTGRPSGSTSPRRTGGRCVIGACLHAAQPSDAKRLALVGELLQQRRRGSSDASPVSLA